jgi:hypothetical protein
VKRNPHASTRLANRYANAFFDNGSHEALAWLSQARWAQLQGSLLARPACDPRQALALRSGVLIDAKGERSDCCEAINCCSGNSNSAQVLLAQQFFS